ncbi:MAG: hypothetical protein AB7G75_29290 [Candidatus Binatia bacterium]
MEQQQQYDPYYRNFAANLVPVRTPFTRPGRLDAGHVFIYLTNMWKRWSLLLDKTRTTDILPEARLHIPRGISQFWLVEKRYSTPQPRARFINHRQRSQTRLVPKNSPEESQKQDSPGRPLIVLREPSTHYDPQGDVVSYHLKEVDAIAAAQLYTQQHRRRAIVGVLLWDELWL